ncbi:MAG: prolipoprotein diacylglyceryl transferase [Deltaproteobacteria bacterium]|nr:prolipoprotein diacylglyceryl transferase [Deltaproteobacteria bacterium]
MFPFVIHQGDFIIPTFFFMVMVGVLILTFYLYFRAPKLGFSQVIVLDCGIIGAIFGILGARIFHVFFEALWFYQEDWTRVFEFWRGGFVSFGAYIGGSLSVLLYLRLRKVNILAYADYIAMAVPILVMAIRVGCLGAGCCYGKPTDFFLHFVFDHPSSDAGSKFPGVSLHATQLYDFLNGLFLLIFLHWRYARKKFDGEIFILLFGMYSFIRGMIEFLRGDRDRGLYFDGLISTGQITGFVLILICIAGYVYLWRKVKNKEDEETNHE